MAEAVAPVAAVPVGGGAIFPDHDLVVTQPEPGRIIGFRATCTHRGCRVRSIAAGVISCFCHGSRFRIADGSVAGGPAPEPLPRREIEVVDGVVTVP